MAIVNNNHQESWAFNTQVFAVLAKLQRATLIEWSKMLKGKPVNMVKLCNDHPPKFFPNHINFEV